MAKKIKAKMVIPSDPFPDPTISPLGVPAFFPYVPFVINLLKETPWTDDHVVKDVAIDFFNGQLDGWDYDNESAYGHVFHVYLTAFIPFFSKNFSLAEMKSFFDDVEITITLNDGITNQDILVPSISIVPVD